MDATEFNAYNHYPGPLVNFQLPVILELSIKQVNFKAPAYKNIKSSLAKYKEAIEIRIITSQPIPPRAAAAVLIIGKVVVSHYIPGKAANEYLFYAFDLKKLKENELIYWAWSNESVDRHAPTKFYYKAPKKGK
jgi:hypothetical protein